MKTSNTRYGINIYAKQIHFAQKYRKYDIYYKKIFFCLFAYNKK